MTLGARVTVLGTLLLFALGGSAQAVVPLGTINEYRTGLTANSHPRGLLLASDGNLWFTDNAAVGRVTPSGEITEFTGPLTSESQPSGLIAGSGGYMWFIEHRSIGRVSLDGSITEFPLTSGSEPIDLALGAEGDIWFTEGDKAGIGKVTAGGEVTYYSTGLKESAQLGEIVLGREGDLWFADDSVADPAIGRVTPDGEIIEFSTGLEVEGKPESLLVGPDGNLWFADNGVGKAIGRITPGGEVTLYKGNLGEACYRGCGPYRLIDGPEGDIWLTVGAGDRGLIGRITPAGITTEFTPEFGVADRPESLVAAPDGNLWFSSSTEAVSGPEQAIARMTPTGVFSWFSAGLDPESVEDLTVGSDGNVWFVNGPAIGRISVSEPPPTPTPTPIPTPLSLPLAPKIGRISLMHKLLYLSHGVATLKLRCSGNTRCAGKLLFTIRTKRGRRDRSRVVAITNTLAFSVEAGAVESVKVHLRALGQAMLKRKPHRLECTLVLDQRTPPPTSTTRISVQLTERSRQTARSR